MAETYTQERTSAKSDIEASGCPCKVVNRETPATYTETGALILSFTFLERLSGTVIDGDGKFMIPALGNPNPLDPAIYDIVVDSSDPIYASAVGTYEIVNPNPFMIGGVPIYYEAHVRRR